MTAYFGNKKIKDIYYGSHKIKEAYYGSTKVYPSSAGTPLYYCYYSTSVGYFYCTEEVTSTGSRVFYYANSASIASSSSDLVNTYTYNVTSIDASGNITIQAGVIGSIVFERDSQNDLYS